METIQQFIDTRCTRIGATFDATFTWNYERAHSDLTHLYETAKVSQWDAGRDIAWSTQVDPARFDRSALLAVTETDSPFRDLPREELDRLARNIHAWTISQFLHGEQGCLMGAAKVVETAPNIEAKYCASTQVMDEARHVEVFERYSREKVGKNYPINRSLESLFSRLLAEPRWDITFLGFQVLVKSLALSAYEFTAAATDEPLLRQIVERVAQDEARHIEFSLEILADSHDNRSDEDIDALEALICESAELMRDRLLMTEVWEESGLPVKECEKFVESHPMHTEFRRILFAKIVENVRSTGLYSPAVEKRFSSLGIVGHQDYQPRTA